MYKLPILATLCVWALVSLIAPAASADPGADAQKSSASPGQMITIQSFAFSSPALEITVGTRVTWINKDTTVHTVTSTDKAFTSSGGLDSGDKYSFVFTKAGTYPYFCSLHPFMTGKIVVKDK